MLNITMRQNVKTNRLVDGRKKKSLDSFKLIVGDLR